MFGLGKKARRTERGEASNEDARRPEMGQSILTDAGYQRTNDSDLPVSEDSLILDETDELSPMNADLSEIYSAQNTQEVSEMQSEEVDAGDVELGTMGSPSSEKAILHIGPGTVLKGDITTCESLIVQGNLNGTVDASLMLLASGGVVDGTVNVQAAEVEGAFTGTLTVKGLLIVKGGGQIQGTVRYGELEIERGCQLNGDIGQHDANSGKSASNVSRVHGTNPAGVKAA